MKTNTTWHAGLGLGQELPLRRRVLAAVALVSLALALSLTPTALAQTPPPDYGIEFVTVGAVNNPAFQGGPFPLPRWPAPGRGSVSYEYRIGKYEITTAQWMEYENTFKGVPWGQEPRFTHWSGPYRWGVVSDPNYHGPGWRYMLNPTNPNAGMQPVFGISWREAAIYCNWLHNGKSSDPASLLTGAYDTTTWGNNPDGSFTDALTHLPGARYWIPTFDEQLKAFHYDPDRHGPGQGGWWLNKNRRDDYGIPGPPGVGQTSAGWLDPIFEGELEIPLGAYPDQTSPWGLFDTSGGAKEWSEGWAPQIGAPGERFLFGHPAGPQGPDDNIYYVSSYDPGSRGLFEGLRIASSVPSPGAGVLIVYFCVFGLQRKRS
ncbi:MAG: SUMF1/EgtB/PvdO family nonheme iron enzyme [Phycisphaerales bacterium]|nr:SUMF1/EgtB/PvdO family nonheme iron enzyme [Phycisphaerales bacterium]